MTASVRTSDPLENDVTPCSGYRTGLHECCAMRWGAMHNTREKQRLMLQRANSVRAVERQESSLFSEVFLWFRM